MKQTKQWIPSLIFLLGIALSAGAQTDIEFGNVNRDEKINIIDALLTAQYSVGLNPPGFYPETADVNASGDITIIDALMIARYTVGLLKIFPAEQASVRVEVLSSELQRNPDPDAAANEVRSAVAGMNQFGFDCYSELTEDDKNLFISPLSINYAFAMCYAGAAGNTKTQIKDTMHITLPEDRYHNALNDLEQIITAEPDNSYPGMGDELQLNLANSTWGQHDYTFLTSFLDILAIHYGAALNAVDFRSQPEACRLLINDWVSDQTENRINNLIPQGVITTMTRLVITNAIYFKANWLYPFKTNNTRPGNFYAPGGVVSVDMMNQEIHTTFKEVPGSYEIIRLPYQGTKSNSMYIIVPVQGQFEAVESQLSEETWNDFVSGMRSYNVNLGMPKFSFEWDASLKTALSRLGMTEAFIPDIADFSGIDGSQRLYISDVLHKSFIAVDEKGTEASAATAVVFAETSIPETVSMTINRPFIFLIKNETGANLFMGRVMTP